MSNFIQNNNVCKVVCRSLRHANPGVKLPHMFNAYADSYTLPSVSGYEYVFKLTAVLSRIREGGFRYDRNGKAEH